MIVKRITSLVAVVMIAGTVAVPAFADGESKNAVPFVRDASSQPLVSGEPKNEPPFNGPVESPTTIVVKDTRDAFRWADAAIGAGAGAGAVFVAAGLAMLLIGTRRRAVAQS